MNPFRQLLEGVWADQEASLAALALGLGLRREQAADALQDVYLMAIQKPPAISDQAELVRWLFRVTVNRCHLEHRRRGRWRRLWGSLTRTWEGEARGTAALPGGELEKEVENAMARLGDDDRALVAMRYFSDLNSREISEIVGLPESTVRGRLRTARRKLALDLADWNDA